MHNIESFFKSINFTPESTLFKELEIEKVVLNKKSEVFNVYLHAKKVLPISEIDLLLDATKNKINNEYKCLIFLSYEEITDEDVLLYVEEIVKRLTLKKPSLISLLENKPIIDDDIIIFEVMSPTEEENIKKEEANIRKVLSDYGLKDYFITTRLNEEKRKDIEEELKEVQAPIAYVEKVKEFNPGSIVLGKAITKEPIDINIINNVGRNITIEGYIESISALERENINIMTLNINDNTKSFLVKIFQKDKDEYLKLKEVLKEDEWFRFNGNIDFDSYSKCLAMSVRNIEKIDNREIIIAQNENPNIILGNHVEGEITPIENILGASENIIVEAYVFGDELLEKDTINIMTLKISDNTSSILSKVFKKNKKEFALIKNGINGAIKKGKWFRFNGNVEFDNYSHEMVLQLWNIELIDSKEEKITDDAEVKRVELHAHTMMSTMDGVIEAKSLVKHAIKLGHKAIAVTDHNAVQAYPDLFHVVCDVNKGKEDSDRFKVLYGAELNVVNDDIDFIFNLKEYSLLNQEYVVFDTETTGFYVGQDQMIEIGAVKIKNGEIIDRFDEFIDPGRTLPQKITDLTCITDEMLKGHDNEE